MAVYLVTYDLNHEIKRPPIVAEIKTTAWAMLSESSYAIKTAETVTEVHNRFLYLLDPDDTFYVIALSRPWTGWGYHEVNAWLLDELGPASPGGQHTY